MNKLKDEIEIFYNNDKINPWSSRESWIKKNSLEDLVRRIHLAIPDDISLRDKIVTIKHYGGLIPLCKLCDNKTKYHSSINRYADYCSKKCSDQSPEKREKARTNINPQQMKEAFIKKYHVANPSQLEQFKKYGDDNSSRRPEVRKKISESNKGKSKTYKGTKPQHIRLTDQQRNIINNLAIAQHEHLTNEIPLTLLSKQYGFSGATLNNAFNRENIDYKIFGGSYIQNTIKEFVVGLEETVVCNHINS